MSFTLGRRSFTIKLSSFHIHTGSVLRLSTRSFSFASVPNCSANVRTPIAVSQPFTFVQHHRTYASLPSLAQSSTSASPLTIVPEGTTLIYSGVIAKAIQALKRVSVVSLFMTWATSPLFAYNLYMGTGNASTAAIAVMVGALVVSTGSTSVIHWCCKPYVVSIASTNSTPEKPARDLTVTRLSFFGTPYAHTVKETNLRVSRARMFTTWESEAGKQLYYVHVDGVEEESELGKVVAGILKREVVLMAGGTGNTSTNLGEKKENWDEVVKKLREKKNE
ncbi:UNVERIFIED_CONTAM: hypothetical protein HDU68_002437 [Siphonaria sp. JEL0065]|nr:hypothetical protein HDU68_002437 [Siphonaria sp. JEL0065]